MDTVTTTCHQCHHIITSAWFIITNWKRVRKVQGGYPLASHDKYSIPDARSRSCIEISICPKLFSYQSVTYTNERTHSIYEARLRCLDNWIYEVLLSVPQDPGRHMVPTSFDIYQTSTSNCKSRHAATVQIFATSLESLIPLPLKFPLHLASKWLIPIIPSLQSGVRSARLGEAHTLKFFSVLWACENFLVAARAASAQPGSTISVKEKRLGWYLISPNPLLLARCPLISLTYRSATHIQDYLIPNKICRGMIYCWLDFTIYRGTSK